MPSDTDHWVESLREQKRNPEGSLEQVSLLPALATTSGLSFLGSGIRINLSFLTSTSHKQVVFYLISGSRFFFFHIAQFLESGSSATTLPEWCSPQCSLHPQVLGSVAQWRGPAQQTWDLAWIPASQTKQAALSQVGDELSCQAPIGRTSFRQYDIPLLTLPQSYCSCQSCHSVQSSVPPSCTLLLPKHKTVGTELPNSPNPSF